MTDDIELREARRADLAEVVRMMVDLRAEQGDRTPDLSAQDLESDLAGERPRVFCIICRVAGADDPSGYALLQPAYEPVARMEGMHLCDIYVRPEARRSGVGTRLMTHALDLAHDRGVRFVWWASKAENAAALGFFARFRTQQVQAVNQAVVFGDPGS